MTGTEGQANRPLYRIECWNCGGEGLDGHDCGEDTCCCLEPFENVPCDVCDGLGYWDSDEEPSDPDMKYWSLEES